MSSLIFETHLINLHLFLKAFRTESRSGDMLCAIGTEGWEPTCSQICWELECSEIEYLCANTVQIKMTIALRKGIVVFLK